MYVYFIFQYARLHFLLQIQLPTGLSMALKDCRFPVQFISMAMILISRQELTHATNLACTIFLLRL
jgi:hypothetical protein